MVQNVKGVGPDRETGTLAQMRHAERAREREIYVIEARPPESVTSDVTDGSSRRYSERSRVKQDYPAGGGLRRRE